MKIMKTLLSALFLMGCVAMSAQAPQGGPKDGPQGAVPQAPQEETEEVFNSHWYIQIAGGAQYTLGEINFNDLVSPNFQVSVGYKFNSVVGARLSVNAYESKAGIKVDHRKYEWSWNYVAPNIDATFDITNLICGYKADRALNFGAFVGIGLNIGWDNDDAEAAQTKIISDKGVETLRYLWDGTKCRFQGQAGLYLDYNITKKFAVGLEVQATTLSDKYNSKKAGNSDWYYNGLISLKYAFGKTSKTQAKKSCCPPCPEPQERIIERIIEKPVPAPAPAPAPEAKVEPLRRDVFFKINSTTISSTEATKVKEVAEYLKKYPEAKVELLGVADKGTGNATINAKLAAKRAEAVQNSLINDYGISSSRISVDSKGDTVQPFPENDNNRVTICIAK